MALQVIHDIKASSDSTATYVTGMNIMTQPQYFINRNSVGQKDTIWTTDTFYVGKLPEHLTHLDQYAWDT